jgi:hypothetical protein
VGVGAKVLAAGSPSLLLLALGGAAVFAVRVERVPGDDVAGAGFSQHAVIQRARLPRCQPRSLRSVERTAEHRRRVRRRGPGADDRIPALRRSPFPRKLDAEGASELRYRSVPLVEGGELEVWLRTGNHELELVYDGQSLYPGRGGSREPIGPLS